MKPSAIVFLILASLCILGYLYYGWLLFQTMISETGIGTRIAFTDLCVLWLLPLLFGLVLLVVELIKKKQR